MRRLLPAVLCVGLAASPLAAQHEHRGFWIGFGLGAGVNLTTTLDNESPAGVTGYLRLGGTPSQSILLGFESIGWALEEDYRGNATFTVIGYPARQGLFLKGGVGFAILNHTESSGNTTISTDVSGFGLTTGLGYDFKIGRNIYLVAGADVLTQFFKEQTAPGLGNIPGTNVILVMTLGLTWH